MSNQSRTVHRDDAGQPVTPGRYRVELGTLERLASVVEDVDTGDLWVRFDGVDRVQRLDEIDDRAAWWPL